MGTPVHDYKPLLWRGIGHKQKASGLLAITLIMEREAVLTMRSFDYPTRVLNTVSRCLRKGTHVLGEVRWLGFLL